MQPWCLSSNDIAVSFHVESCTLESVRLTPRSLSILGLKQTWRDHGRAGLYHGAVGTRRYSARTPSFPVNT